ncbi:MAG: SMC-Scp complex subunit ScpB [Ruminococcaceae bacterium]|nr:SMC-Scp complex subunit ScpB [Oscillospiraceae bacterium]
MDLKEAERIIEAVLFASGDPVTTEELKNILEIENVEEIADAVAAKWDNEKRGIRIKRVADRYYLCSNELYYDYIVKLIEPRRQSGLSNAALETLSIVAYNQPVTRSTIEFVRGVNSDGALSRLVERGLVEECGRLETPGKPLLYRTTDVFLRAFGLSDISELPDLHTLPLQSMFYESGKEEKSEKADEQ